MPSKRKQRMPISCEPCRLRKIRCSREATPCATCVRRNIPTELCRYAQRETTSSVPGSCNAAVGAYTAYPEVSGNGELRDRVQRLEQLLEAQGTSTAPHSATSHPNEISNSSTGARLSGYLRTTASGHVRFIPHSLGLETRLTLSESNTSNQGTSASRSYPFNDGEYRPIRHLLAALPPKSHCSELVRVYFTSFASLFHVLHDPTFQQQYDSFLEDAESTSPAWLALLFAVLAIAVSGLPSDSPVLIDLSFNLNPLSKMADLAAKFRTMAMQFLEADHYLWDHNITTLQALVLLIYGISHSHGQAWSLLGTAHHLALSTGAHIDPSTFGLDAVQCEERRRCWAALKMLYTNQNTAMGNIALAHALLPSNCRPPADVNDVQLVAGQPDEAPQGPSNRATQMTYLLRKFRLYDLCAEICDKVLHSSNAADETLQYFDKIISRDQHDFESQYHGHVQREELPLHHRAHLSILCSYTNHLRLLLHHDNAMSMRLGYESNQRSHWRCVNSAMRLLETHAVLHESSDFAPFRWYNNGLGGFHAFHAAVVLIALHRKDLTEVRGPLQQCLSRFKSLRGLSPLCAKAAPILEQLLAGIDGRSTRFDGSGQFTQENWPSLDLRTPTSLTSNSFDNSNNAPSNDIDWDLFWPEFQAQQWIIPAELPWEQWNSITSNL